MIHFYFYYEKSTGQMKEQNRKERKKSHQQRKSRKRDRMWIIRLIVGAASAITLAICASVLLPKLFEYAESAETYRKITGDAVHKPDEPDNSVVSMSSGSDSKSYDDPLVIDWEKFKGQDVVAWLQLDDVGYPVMQGVDNSFYLHRLPDKSWNYGGSIFLNADNSADFSDSHSVIYGHNMADGSMFGKFHWRYMDSRYKDHTFDLYLPDGTRHIYTFFSVISTTGGSDVYDTEFKYKEAFFSYQKRMKELSIYQNSPDPDKDAHLVSLSTCNGVEGTRNRLVIQGKETSVRQTQKAASWWKDKKR